MVGESNAVQRGMRQELAQINDRLNQLERKVSLLSRTATVVSRQNAALKTKMDAMNENFHRILEMLGETGLVHQTPEGWEAALHFGELADQVRAWRAATAAVVAASQERERAAAVSETAPRNANENEHNDDDI